MGVVRLLLLLLRVEIVLEWAGVESRYWPRSYAAGLGHVSILHNRPIQC
jgi:hypothetical protein